VWRRWLCKLLRFLSSVSPGVLQNLTWQLRVHRRRSFVKVFVSCRASVPSLKFVKEKPFVSRQSSTVVADPRGNETSSEVVTADLLTCYLRVAEADLLHLFHPLHFDGAAIDQVNEWERTNSPSSPSNNQISKRTSAPHSSAASSRMSGKEPAPSSLSNHQISKRTSVPHSSAVSSRMSGKEPTPPPSPSNHQISKRTSVLLDTVLCCHPSYWLAAATSSVWGFQINDWPVQRTLTIQNVYR